MVPSFRRRYFQRFNLGRADDGSKSLAESHGGVFLISVNGCVCPDRNGPFAAELFVILLFMSAVLVISTGTAMLPEWGGPLGLESAFGPISMVILQFMGEKRVTKERNKGFGQLLGELINCIGWPRALAGSPLTACEANLRWLSPL